MLQILPGFEPTAFGFAVQYLNQIASQIKQSQVLWKVIADKFLFSFPSS